MQIKFTLLFLFIIHFSTINGQNKLISREIINIKTTNYWDNLSNDEKTNLDTSALKSLDFYEIVYWSDSLKIKGFLIEPKTGTNLPTIIFNRGGNRDFGALTVQTLIEWLTPIAKEGYVIIASQYRGNSTNLGKDEFGGKDVNDILNLFPVINELPKADTTRIGIYGWSRGGMMTYLTLSKTNKLKAVIIGGAPSDLVSELKRRPEMEKVYTELIPNYATNKEQELQNRSVMYWPEKLSKTSSYLILHGKSDSRVDYFQALNIITKLKSLNYKVEGQIFDNSDHIISEKRSEKDAKIISWLKLNL